MSRGWPNTDYLKLAVGDRVHIPSGFRSEGIERVEIVKIDHQGLIAKLRMTTKSGTSFNTTYSLVLLSKHSGK